MEGLIKYFEALEHRIATLESQLVANEVHDRDLQARLLELEAKIAKLEEQEPLSRPADTTRSSTQSIQDFDSVAGHSTAYPDSLHPSRTQACLGQGEVPEEPEEPEVEVELVFNEEEEPLSRPTDTLSPSRTQACLGQGEVESEIPEEPEQPVRTEGVLAPVTELRKAISLGDRFLFVRELFNNSGEKMQKTVDEIDQLKTLDEAYAYIEKHYKWDKESKAYELFENALKRRFS